jgi:hypothetical protein
MKKSIVLLAFLSLGRFGFAQQATPIVSDSSAKTTVAVKDYWQLMEEGDSLMQAKNYKAAARVYSDADPGGLAYGSRIKRYKAARAWAMAGVPDSTFDANLFKVLYLFHQQLATDEAFESVHADPRWQPYLDVVKKNQTKYAKFNEQIALELYNIIAAQDKYRLRLESYEKQYGPEAKETEDMKKQVVKQDTATLRSTTAFLDKYGWVGMDVVGDYYAPLSILGYISDLANLKTQDKYVPILNEGAKDNVGYRAALAPLIDKVELAHDRPQIYGTQGTFKDGKFEYYPIKNEADADKLRKELGLEPLDVNKRRANGEVIPQTPPFSKGGKK